MAAIDKLYIRDFEALIELKKWALAYYPKLFIYMYPWAFTITQREYEGARMRRAKALQKLYKEEWSEISPNGTLNCGVAHLMEECSEWTESDAVEEAKYIKSRAEMSIEELRKDIGFPVLNTPLKVDKKLKWICPLPTVRMYLQENCGVKEHWWYKLFWKGRKEFDY